MSLYETLGEAEVALEPIDIESNEYTIFDSEGPGDLDSTLGSIEPVPVDTSRFSWTPRDIAEMSEGHVVSRGPSTSIERVVLVGLILAGFCFPVFREMYDSTSATVRVVLWL